MTALTIPHKHPLEPPPGDLVFTPEEPEDAAAVEDLIERAFGPGRFAKTAERLREGNRPRLDLSVCAWLDDRIVGAARQWPILIGDTATVFLGPFAVESDVRRRGLGATLIDQASEAALAAGERMILLVGDEPYFGPLGFEPVPRGRIVLPGPVNPARVLWKPLVPGAFEGVGGAVRIPPED